MSTREKASKLAAYIESLDDFQIVKVDEPYNHMGATITDAMLQAGLRYETVVRPRVNKLIQQYPEGRTTSGFLHLLNRVGPNALLDWSDGDKPNRVLGVTQYFAQQGIESEADLKAWLQDSAHLGALKSLRGIGDKTADYFKILVGMPTAAIDRHLDNFLSAAGVHIRGYGEAQAVIHFTADLLGISRADLDHSIWKFMSSSTSAAEPLAQSKPISTKSSSEDQGSADFSDKDLAKQIQDSATVSIARFFDDDSYRDWLDSHPAGYVLNINRYNADDIKLHRAECKSISMHMRNRSLTMGASEKVASDSKTVLLEYARGRFHHIPNLTCQKCGP